MGLTNNITQGMFIKFNNEPHLVLEKEFYSPGKGSAFNRTKLKSLITGKIITQTFKSGEKVDEIDVERKSMQYIYVDGDEAYFMDPKTFEQISVSLDAIDGGTSYLHPEAKYVTMFYEGLPINVQVPAKITLKVISTTDANKGNTANNATKEAELETGAKVQVPMFVKNGDSIIISTESNSYFSKA